MNANFRRRMTLGVLAIVIIVAVLASILR